MDKVKHFLEVARKHHFWILCGVAAIIGLVVLSMASGKLTAQTKERKDKIDQKLKAVTGITAPTPNPTWEEGITALADKARKTVREAWTDEFDKQKREIFVWPTALGKDFIDDITKVENGKQTEIDSKFRIRYLNEVLQLAKGLPTLVDAEVIQDAAANGAVAPMPMVNANGEPILVDRKVIWDQGSQQAIFDTFTWYEAPSTTVLRQAQEELWVYKGLCNVIAEVNKNAKGSHDAPITGIQEMSIAYSAHSGVGGGMAGFGGMNRGVIRVKGAALGGGGDMMRAPTASPDGGAAPAGTPPDPKTRCKGAVAGNMSRPGLGATPGGDAAGAPSGNPDDMWKGFRYVDETGKPLATAAEVDASALEFNLMPFRMRLTINPKDLDEFLIACRNSVLPIEVREVDLLEGPGGASAPSSPAMGMPRGGGGPRRGEEGEFGGGGVGGHMPSPTMPSGVGQGVPQQKTVQVEVAGVVYLLKSPEAAKTPEGGAPADGGTPAAPPENATAPGPMVPQATNNRQRNPIARPEAIRPASAGLRIIRRV
jgi:hypothetical protein